MLIHLENLKLEDFFNALANAFNTDYRKAHAAYILEIPSAYGSGSFMGINYPNGVGFLTIDGVFNQDIQFLYDSHQIHPLRFVYALNGQCMHRFNDENIQHLIEQYHSVIIASKYPHGNTFSFEKDKPLSITFLEIDRKVFISQLARDAHDMKDKFYELFFDTYATRTFYHKGLYSLQLAQIIQEIADFDKEGFVRTNFIGAKTLEMLSYMLLQYEDDLREDQKAKVLRKFELNAIHDAAGYINNNLSELPSVEQIAQKVHITASKLQEGFKQVYQCTVNEFITDKRLETAFKLLSERNMPINEVILEVGLTSRSYFSKIFKKKYKVLPIEVKKR